MTVAYVVLTGQSNANFLHGAVGQAVARAEQLLGLDGSTDALALVAADGDGTAAPATMLSGTPLLPLTYNPGHALPWLDASPGSPSGFAPGRSGYETRLARYLAQHIPQGSPTIVINLHNESNATDLAGTTTRQWQNGLRQQEADITAALRLPPNAAPMGLLWVPYDYGNGRGVDDGVGGRGSFADTSQRLHAAQYSLTQSRPGTYFTAAEAGDMDMSRDFGGQTGNGNGHFSDRDASRLIDRLAQSLARRAAGIFGRRLALDAAGPQIVAAASVAGAPRQVLLSLRITAGTRLQPLGTLAAAGAGFNLEPRGGAGGRTAGNNNQGNIRAVAAACAGVRLLVTFARPVPEGARFYYGSYGDGRIDASPDGPGEGAAVYGRTAGGISLPLWSDPNGLPVSAPER